MSRASELYIETQELLQAGHSFQIDPIDVIKKEIQEMHQRDEMMKQIGLSLQKRFYLKFTPSKYMIEKMQRLTYDLNPEFFWIEIEGSDEIHLSEPKEGFVRRMKVRTKKIKNPFFMEGMRTKTDNLIDDHKI